MDFNFCFRLWGVEAGKVLEKLRNPGGYDYTTGCPIDQLFWCNVYGTTLAVGSYHGNMYIINLSTAVFERKNKMKLRMIKRETERKYQTFAKSVVTDALTKASNIVRCLLYVELNSTL